MSNFSGSSSTSFGSPSATVAPVAAGPQTHTVAATPATTPPARKVQRQIRLADGTLRSRGRGRMPKGAVYVD